MRIRYPVALCFGIILFMLSILFMVFDNSEGVRRGDVIACTSIILVGFSVEVKENKEKNGR